MKKLSLWMAVVLLLVGCNVSVPWTSKTKAEQRIEQLNLSHQVELTEKVAVIAKVKDRIISNQDNQLQSVANSLYGADRAFTFYQPPSRLDLIIHNRVVEAATVTGKAPTYEAIVLENKRLNEERDETLCQHRSETHLLPAV